MRACACVQAWTTGRGQSLAQKVHDSLAEGLILIRPLPTPADGEDPEATHAPATHDSDRPLPEPLQGRVGLCCHSGQQQPGYASKEPRHTLTLAHSPQHGGYGGYDPSSSGAGGSVDFPPGFAQAASLDGGNGGLGAVIPEKHSHALRMDMLMAPRNQGGQQQLQQPCSCTRHFGLVVQSASGGSESGCYVLKATRSLSASGCSCTHYSLTEVVAGQDVHTQLQNTWLDSC